MSLPYFLQAAFAKKSGKYEILIIIYTFVYIDWFHKNWPPNTLKFP